MSEVWQDIAGYEGRYQVSTHGRVKSLSFAQRYLLRNGAEAYRRTTERFIAQQKINSGYFIVHLHLNGKRKAYLVHRLVAGAFIGSGEVNHRDGVKTNNLLANLEIVTRTENHLHAVKLRLNKQAIPVIHPATGVRHASMAQAARADHTSIATVKRRYMEAR